MTLDGLEDLLKDRFGSKDSSKRKKSGVHLIRYADDFIITGKTKEILELEIIPLYPIYLRLSTLFVQNYH